MAKIYKVNGYQYNYNDFVATLTDKIREYWYDGVMATDKQEFDMFVLRMVEIALDGIENFGETVSYGEFDFWAEEE